VTDLSEAAALEQLTSLLDGAHLAAPDATPGVVAAAAATLGWSARIYLVDYNQRFLVPLPIGDGAELVTEDVDATLAGRAFRSIAPVLGAADGRPRLWVPLLDGVERLGVIELRFRAGTDLESVRIVDQIRWFSHLVGHLIAAKSPYSDNFHIARLAGQRTVASELIWAQLPPLTVACHDLVISGLLEPAEQVAGDVFDYAVEAGIAHVAMFDATGHDLHSSVIGSLALGAFRNGRRRSEDLSQTAARVDDTLIEYGLDTYATGVIGNIDLASGTFRYVNAGHLSPLLLRAGKVVKSLDGGRRIMLGFPGRSVEPAEEHLEPGDVVVIYTDGVVEARDKAREFFGLDRLIDLLERSAAEHRRPPETLRGLIHRVLDHQGGLLQDDASVVLLAWKSDSAQQMTAAGVPSSEG